MPYPARAAEYGAAGQRRYRERFPAARTGVETCEVYRRVLQDVRGDRRRVRG